MELWGIILLVFLVVFFFYFSACLIIVSMANKKLFGVRGKDPVHSVYVHFEDYPNLERESYECLFHFKKIRGFIYKKKGLNQDQLSGFIILSHGMFGSHIQYLVDINYLCEAGYQVLCYDQYGVSLSDGESQVSLYQGIPVLDAVLNDVKKKGMNHGLPCYLYGHSWGAYCCLGVLKKHPEIQKAVLRSGPVKPSKAALGIVRLWYPKLYVFLKPVLAICMFFLCGKKSLTPSTSGFSKNGKTEILVVYAKDDPIVDEKNSQYYFFKSHPSPQVKLLCTEKGLHNSIITEESFGLFSEKTREWKRILTLSDETKKAREEEFLSSFSRADLVIYNSEVKDGILNFLS